MIDLPREAELKPFKKSKSKQCSITVPMGVLTYMERLPHDIQSNIKVSLIAIYEWLILNDATADELDEADRILAMDYPPPQTSPRLAISYTKTSSGKAQIFFTVGDRINELRDMRGKYLIRVASMMFIKEIQRAIENPSDYKPVRRPSKSECESWQQ